MKKPFPKSPQGKIPPNYIFFAIILAFMLINSINMVYNISVNIFYAKYLHKK